MQTILKYMARTLAYEVNEYFEKNENEIEEIRLRVNKPIAIKMSSRILVTNHIVSTEEIKETFEKICENSIYSYKRQICEGFITLPSGHRVGITGNCVFENGQVVNVNYISSLNFRIAREKKNCSNEIIKYIINNREKQIYNTLILSRPGGGKTTILRDIIRKISDGIQEYNFLGKTCGIVDERGEIAAMSKGIPQNDVGILTDVIDNISKAKGMNILIRSMAPEVIACDEIGSKEDVEAINYAICSGVKGIFTAHGENLEELLLNPELKKLLDKFIIERIIFLDSEEKGKIKNIYYLEKETQQYQKFENMVLY